MTDTERLAAYIAANGPVSLTSALSALHMGGYSRHSSNLRHWMETNGRIQYDPGTKLWSRAPVPNVAVRVREFRPLVVERGFVREGALDYRAIPSRYT